MTDQPKKLYTIEEVAELLRFDTRTIRTMIKAKKIPAFRIGWSWRIDEADLYTWLEAHKSY